jgi:hypothetical protein
MLLMMNKKLAKEDSSAAAEGDGNPVADVDGHPEVN